MLVPSRLTPTQTASLPGWPVKVEAVRLGLKISICSGAG